MDKTFTTYSSNMTQEAGRQLAACLTAGDFLALVGGLGAGKTNFTQGVCQGLGVKSVVNSPTFTLINIYDGRLPVFHFDLYRLNNMSELDELGYEEYFWGHGVTLVEWADRARDLFPAQRLEIELRVIAVESRQIHLRAIGLADHRFQPFLDFIHANFGA